jgi:hypothetical protein
MLIIPSMWIEKLPLIIRSIHHDESEVRQAMVEQVVWHKQAMKVHQPRLAS